jgi:LmbE family N-acetylglucosaminyl deacetylase
VTPPFRALIVAAHPDDIEFACAGTVALWTDLGAEVTYCMVTDGSTGTQDQDQFGSSLATIRRDESLRAAEVAGVDDVVFLDHKDGYVTYSPDLRRDIARVVPPELASAHEIPRRHPCSLHQRALTDCGAGERIESSAQQPVRPA